MNEREVKQARPEWVKCIAHGHAALRMGNPWQPDGTRGIGEPLLAWCGRDVRHEWTFTSIEHAAYTHAHGDYLMACSECLDAVEDVLSDIEAGCIPKKLAALLEAAAAAEPPAPPYQGPPDTQTLTEIHAKTAATHAEVQALSSYGTRPSVAKPRKTADDDSPWVKDVMVKDVFSLSPKTTVAAALSKLWELGHSKAPVQNDGGLIVGMVSKLALMKQLAVTFPISGDIPVSSVMETTIPAVRWDASLAEAIAFMATRNHRWLLVTGPHGLVAGVLTPMDVIRHMAVGITGEVKIVPLPTQPTSQDAKKESN